MERIKKGMYEQVYSNKYFWRTYAGQEVDYIEESAGGYLAFECKWQGGKEKHLKVFQERYKNTEIKLVNKENLMQKFVIL